MYEIKWNLLKSERLKKTRGVSFEEIIQSQFINAMEHPGRDDQNVMLFFYKRHIWVVPYVQKGGEIFLKTLYPSRKYTKLYKRGEKQ